MMRNYVRPVFAGALLGAFVSLTAPAFAFGEVGQQAIGAMSAKLVSEKTLQFALSILRVRPPEVAVRRVQLWAEQHPNEEILRWKTKLLPASGGYDKTRDCPDGACPVERIAEFSRVAADKSASNDARSDAFAYLMHFVADVHMPMPTAAAADVQKGSWVKIGDKTRQMQLWRDDEFLRAYGDDPLTVMDSLGVRLKPENEKGWASGTPQEWQTETFNATREFLAKLNINPEAGKTEANPIVLSVAQADDVRDFIGQQMQKAGVRLAFILDQTAK